jgi:hypothetical protein
VGSELNYIQLWLDRCYHGPQHPLVVEDRPQPLFERDPASGSRNAAEADFLQRNRALPFDTLQPPVTESKLDRHAGGNLADYPKPLTAAFLLRFERR